MQIEILTEDKSGAVVVERLANRICAAAGRDVQISVRPHRGCGSLPKDMNARPPKFASSLLDLLPAKCRAYDKVYAGSNLILVVVMDSDNHDPNELRSRLYSVCRQYAPRLRSVVGLCTEEIEAWLLGDKNAIQKAYPLSDMQAYEEYEQDSVCGTWEMLCKVVCADCYEDLIDIGYPAIGHYKAKWAEKISTEMLPENNVSPSYRNFQNSLLVALKNPHPITITHTSFGR